MKSLAALLCLGSFLCFGQTQNDTTSFNTRGKVTIQGYVDAYYAYDFNRPSSRNRPYFVSMAKHNEMTINLAYVSLRYNASRLRCHLTPGFGTYMNANYANEPGTLKNLVEAMAGVRLFPGKEIWLDAGIFSSPYTNEGAVSKDHLAYTRSFAPEYVPYYLSGVKLSVPLSYKWTATFYLMNGWQQIADVNNQKSVGTELHYRATGNLQLKWVTYVGNEYSADMPQNGMRYFSDVYFIYNRGRISMTGSTYYGIQERTTGRANWWQANVSTRYSFNDRLSVTGRVEYFNDPKSAQITPITDVTGFDSGSSSLGLNYKLGDVAIVRFEGRTFFSDKAVYLRGGQPVKNSNLLTTNLTLWF